MPRLKAMLSAASIEMTKDALAAGTRPKRMAPTTASRMANKAIGGVLTGLLEPNNIPSPQIATASIHSAPDFQCPMNCARLRRLNATRIGPTRITPAAVLIHQRSQLIGLVASAVAFAR